MKQILFVCSLIALSLSVLAQQATDLQRLRDSYDKAIRPITEDYLKELVRLHVGYVQGGRRAEAQEIETEINLVKDKLAAMGAPLPNAASHSNTDPTVPGHGSVLLDARATIPANSADGYHLGAVRQGDVVTLQYVEGLWKALGHLATENPDAPKLEHGDESRLVIAHAPVNGKPGNVIAMVPPGTITKPFTFTIPTTREDIILRIYKNSDNPKNPGSVVYQVKITR
jgi:hypothetical protein